MDSGVDWWRAIFKSWLISYTKFEIWKNFQFNMKTFPEFIFLWLTRDNFLLLNKDSRTFFYFLRFIVKLWNIRILIIAFLHSNCWAFLLKKLFYKKSEEEKILINFVRQDKYKNGNGQPLRYHENLLLIW